MAKSKSTITENYTIPSMNAKDSIYGFEVPEVFTLRAMTTLEEKMRLAASDGFKVIPKIIKACSVNPECKKFDFNLLKLFDLQYLMYKLRIVTYGPEYEVEIICPHCGSITKVNVNLDDIPVRDIPEDFHEPFDIGPLPVSGDTYGCRFITTKDYNDMRSEAERIIKRSKGSYQGDPEFIIKWKYIILTKNNEDIPANEIQSTIESMHAKDLRYLESKYDKMNTSFGLDLSMIEKCDNCGEDIDFTLPMTNEFFRPEY